MKINLFSPWYSWTFAELALNNNHSLTPISPRAEQDSGFTEREGESPRLFIGIYILFSWYFFKLYFKRTQELPTSLDPQQPRFNSGGKGVFVGGETVIGRNVLLYKYMTIHFWNVLFVIGFIYDIRTSILSWQFATEKY